MWNYEGMWVKGKYLGEFDVSGKVTKSRVKFGGGVTHHITIDQPLELYGKHREVGEVIILEHEFVTQVKDLNG